MNKMDNEKEYEAQIDALEVWFRENEKLPTKIDRLLLRRFYQCMNGDLQEIKKLIEINYTIRNNNPNIFIKRDPIDEDSRRTFTYADIIPLPGLTPDRCKATLYRFRDFDPVKMHHTEDTRAFFMVTDCRFCCIDDVRDPDILSVGEIQIFDMEGCTMRHATRLKISTLRAYVKFLQMAFPVRLKAIHMINCPPNLERIVGVVKPFISEEVFRLIVFHKKIEPLYKSVPHAMLPNEYGGSAGSLNYLREQVAALLNAKRNYLIDPDYWLVEKATSHSWSFF